MKSLLSAIKKPTTQRVPLKIVTANLEGLMMATERFAIHSSVGDVKDKMVFLKSAPKNPGTHG